MPVFKSRAELAAIHCPDSKPFIEVWHEHEPGFGARVMRENKRSGLTRRSYLVRYQSLDGKDVKQVMGTMEDTAYDDALFKCRDKRRSVEQAKRLGLNAPPKVGEVLTQYLAERKHLAADTVTGYTKKWKALEKYNDLVFTELNVQFWKSRHVDIETANGTSTAHQVCRIAHAIYESLIADGIAATNPVAALKKFGIYDKPEPRGDYVRRASMPALWYWLNHHAHPGVRDFMMVELFSGFRYSVVGSMTWENYSAENRAYQLLPDQRGNKKRQLVWFPVCDFLAERVFEPRGANKFKSPYVIPSHKKIGQPLHSVRGSFAALNRATGIRISSHSLRRTFATLAHATVKDILMVSRLLTHAQRPKFVQVPNTPDYIQPVDEDLRLAVNTVAAAILRVCEGKPVREDAPNNEDEPSEPVVVQL